MKLNARDQLILVVVLVVLIWILGIMYFIKPSIEGAKNAQNTLDDKNTELLSKEKLIEDDKNLEQDVQDAYDKATETASIFYPRAVQHVAATELQSKFNVDGDDEQDIKNTNLTISTVGKGVLKKYIYNDQAVNATLDDIVAKVDGSGDAAIVTAINIDLTAYSFGCNFTATKEDLIKFMENLLSNDHKSMVITSLTIPSIGENENDTDWAGTMKLDYYMVPGLPTPEEVDSREDANTESTDEAAG